jgi:hypothetical protein
MVVFYWVNGYKTTQKHLRCQEKPCSDLFGFLINNLLIK